MVFMLFLLVWLSGCDLCVWEEPRVIPGYGRLYIVVDSNGEPLDGMLAVRSEYSGWPTRVRLYPIREGQCVLPEVVDREVGGGSALLGFRDGMFMRTEVLNPRGTDIDPLVPGFVEVSRTGEDWFDNWTTRSGDDEPVPVTIVMKRACIQDEYEHVRYILSYWPGNGPKEAYFRHAETAERARTFAGPYLLALESLVSGLTEDEEPQLTPLPLLLEPVKEDSR
jgi:hypothetical protein